MGRFAAWCSKPPSKAAALQPSIGSTRGSLGCCASSPAPNPIADLFPLMGGQDFEELVRSIKEIGQRDAITTFNGLILDGRNRYRACQAAGVEPLMEEYTGDDPLAYVVDKNLRRRHSTLSQSGLIAAEMATRRRGRADKSSVPTISAAAAADLMDVGLTTVVAAKVVLRDGTAEDIATTAPLPAGRSGMSFRRGAAASWAPCWPTSSRSPTR
jgi:hypothetical protein